LIAWIVDLKRSVVAFAIGNRMWFKRPLRRALRAGATFVIGSSFWRRAAPSEEL
jgi:hypothetical protein